MNETQPEESKSAASACSDFDWPTDEGIWMGFIEPIGWFPMKTKGLIDDLGSNECLAILAQFPKSKDDWPFTFKGCHPATKWRRPTDEEMSKAKIFYGIV